ncbi:uncharacterized protein LOC132266993 [Cornus florida]|uniref:uncharacterized protein LOC132266993 n=1 Tax=Cornus florida TaxID=4283 RepID=UPI0028974ADF|nr:uncharacterized protein LOC132266993 [Cornus florida]XP_059624011.1 uncharacterized protein LOC132266993 [Cornus florida]
MFQSFPELWDLEKREHAFSVSFPAAVAGEILAAALVFSVSFAAVAEELFAAVVAEELFVPVFFAFAVFDTEFDFAFSVPVAVSVALVLPLFVASSHSSLSSLVRQYHSRPREVWDQRLFYASCSCIKSIDQ